MRTEETVFPDGKTITVYDGLGRQVSLTDYNEEGVIWHTVTYTYEGDSFREKERTVINGVSAKITTIFTFEYDTQERKILMQEKNGIGDILATTRYTYNENNGLIHVCNYDKDDALISERDTDFV